MSAPLIDARCLQKRFDKTSALRSFSLSLSPGEIYGLVGPDGAGKTTAMRLVVGLMTPTSGTVAILGRGTAIGVDRAAIGYVPQRNALWGDLSVSGSLWFFGMLFGLDRATYRRRADELLAVTRLAPFARRRVRELSGGMYKKLAVACALLHRPRILVLDEPTTGVDPTARLELWQLIRDRVQDGQVSVLMSTSYMDEAARCDRVGLMLRGELIEEGAPSELLRNFRSEVFALRGHDREQLTCLVEKLPAVLAVTPASHGIRIVVRAGNTDALARVVQEHGLQLERQIPKVEDVFLARMGEGHRE